MQKYILHKCNKISNSKKLKNNLMNNKIKYKREQRKKIKINQKIKIKTNFQD